MEQGRHIGGQRGTGPVDGSAVIVQMLYCRKISLLKLRLKGTYAFATEATVDAVFVP